MRNWIPVKSKLKSVSGIILVGGRSQRFGSDKSLYLINGKSMGRMIADKMRAAGIDQVFAVGGSREIADTLGVSFLADLYPEEGPLGGLLTAMMGVSTETICVLPCDVPLVSQNRLLQLVAAVSDSGRGFKDVSVLTTSRDHWLCSAWRVNSCLALLKKQFDQGERAIHRVANLLSIQRVIATETEMNNINTLQDACELGRLTEIGD